MNHGFLQIIGENTAFQLPDHQDPRLSQGQGCRVWEATVRNSDVVLSAGAGGRVAIQEFKAWEGCGLMCGFKRSLLLHVRGRGSRGTG